MNEKSRFFSYLPVNDEVIRRGMYVTSTGRQKTSIGQQFPPKEHPRIYNFQWETGRILPEFAIVLFTEGKGEFESKTADKTVIESNSVVLLTPGQWHRYHPDPKFGFTERWICFNGEIPHDLLDRGLLNPINTIMPVRQPELLIRQFDELLDYIQQQPGINPTVLTHYAISLVGQTLVSTDRPVDFDPTIPMSNGITPSDPLVKLAIDHIWNYSHCVSRVEDLLEQMPTSRRTLERRFHTCLGRNILDEINLCRLSRAQRLLSETVLILKRVAYLSGFSSPDHMRLVFLKSIHQTPTQYRQKTKHNHK